MGDAFDIDERIAEIEKEAKTSAGYNGTVAQAYSPPANGAGANGGQVDQTQYIEAQPPRRPQNEIQAPANPQPDDGALQNLPSKETIKETIKETSPTEKFAEEKQPVASKLPHKHHHHIEMSWKVMLFLGVVSFTLFLASAAADFFLGYGYETTSVMDFIAMLLAIIPIIYFLTMLFVNPQFHHHHEQIVKYIEKPFDNEDSQRLKFEQGQFELAQQQLKNDQDKLVQDSENLARDTQNLQHNLEQLQSDREELTAEREALHAEQMKLETKRNQLTVDSELLAVDYENLADERNHFTEAQKQFEEAQKELTAEQNKVMESQKQLTVESVAIAAASTVPAAKQPEKEPAPSDEHGKLFYEMERKIFTAELDQLKQAKQEIRLESQQIDKIGKQNGLESNEIEISKAHLKEKDAKLVKQVYDFRARLADILAELKTNDIKELQRLYTSSMSLIKRASKKKQTESAGSKKRNKITVESATENEAGNSTQQASAVLSEEKPQSNLSETIPYSKDNLLETFKSENQDN